MTRSHAIQTAVNSVRKTCATGHWGGRKEMKISPAIQAAACKAAAEWEAKKGAAHANLSAGCLPGIELSADEEAQLLDRARERLARIELHERALELSWDESLHPRGHGGKWIDKLARLIDGMDNHVVKSMTQDALDAAKRGDHHTARKKLFRAAGTASVQKPHLFPHLTRILDEAGGPPQSKHEVFGKAVASGKTRAVGVRKPRTKLFGRFAKTAQEIKGK